MKKGFDLSELSAASGSIRVVEMKCEEVNQWTLMLLKLLNSIGIPLEKITIHCRSSRRSGCVSYLPSLLILLSVVRQFVSTFVPT